MNCAIIPHNSLEVSSVIIYVSSPAIDKSDKEGLEQVARVTASLLDAGLNPFAPMLYADALKKHLTEGLDWKYFHYAFMRQSSQMLELRLPGWESCQSMSEARGIAENFGIPVAIFTEQAINKPDADLPEMMMMAIAQVVIDSAHR